MSRHVVPLLEARDLRIGHAASPLVSLTFTPATFTVLTGDHVSGKDALLRALGQREVPERGEVVFEGVTTRDLSDEARCALRNRRLGYLFAAPFLLPSLTVVENIAMPLFRFSPVDAAEARQRTDEVLDFVGLTETAQTRVEALSAAEQHAVSLARSLAIRPALLLAENLDAELGGEDLQHICRLLRASCGRFGVAVIASMSPEFFAAKEDRVIEMAAGAVVRDSAVFGEVGA